MINWKTNVVRIQFVFLFSGLFKFQVISPLFSGFHRVKIDSLLSLEGVIIDYLLWKPNWIVGRRWVLIVILRLRVKNFRSIQLAETEAMIYDSFELILIKVVGPEQMVKVSSETKISIKAAIAPLLVRIMEWKAVGY